MTKSWDEFAGDDRINTYDLIAAAQELRDELETEEREPTDEETEFLRSFYDIEGCTPGWSYGEELIREDTFEDYARELADDIGALPPANQWPTSYIDWERAARELAMDYTCVEFLGYDYLVRS